MIHKGDNFPKVPDHFCPHLVDVVFWCPGRILVFFFFLYEDVFCLNSHSMLVTLAWKINFYYHSRSKCIRTIREVVVVHCVCVSNVHSPGPNVDPYFILVRQHRLPVRVEIHRKGIDECCLAICFSFASSLLLLFACNRIILPCSVFARLNVDLRKNFELFLILSSPLARRRPQKRVPIGKESFDCPWLWLASLPSLPNNCNDDCESWKKKKDVQTMNPQEYNWIVFTSQHMLSRGCFADNVTQQLTVFTCILSLNFGISSIIIPWIIESTTFQETIIQKEKKLEIMWSTFEQQGEKLRFQVLSKSFCCTIKNGATTIHSFIGADQSNNEVFLFNCTAKLMILCRKLMLCACHRWSMIVAWFAQPTNQIEFASNQWSKLMFVLDPSPLLLDTQLDR